MSIAAEVNPRTHVERQEVEEIRTVEALAALEPAWEALAQDARLSHPFASHLWTRTFWDAFGPPARLKVLVVRRGGRIVAIAPLASRTRTILGVPYRAVETIRNPHSPRSELILTEDPDASCRAILAHLLRDASSWDMLELAHVPAASASLTTMQLEAEGLGLKTRVVDFDGSPYIALPGRWEIYRSSLPRNHRSNLKNRRGRLERLGPVSLETISTGVSDRDLEDAFRLEAVSWKGAAGSAIVSETSTLRFYRTLTARAARRGWLYLQFLTVGGKRIAMCYSLLYDDRILALKSGYDPEFATYSPSNLLHLFLLEHAVEHGLREFDFLGDPQPWKLAWTSTVRPHRWLYVFPNHLRARCLHLAKFGALARLRAKATARAARPVRS